MEAEAQLLASRAAWFLSRGEDSWRHLRRGLALAEGGSLELRSQLLTQNSMLLAYENETEHAVSVGREAWSWPLHRRQGAHRRVALATALYVAEDRACLHHCQEALAAARREGDVGLEGEALQSIISFTDGMGIAWGALDASAGVERAVQLDLRSLEARLRAFEAMILLAGGEHTRALETFRALFCEEVWLGNLVTFAKALYAAGLADTGQLREADEPRGSSGGREQHRRPRRGGPAARRGGLAARGPAGERAARG